MSHGGGESGRGHEKAHHTKRKSGSSNDEFSQAIAKIAVAQICESAGFQAFQQSALDLLSDITVRYIHNLGKLSQSYANLAGRTEGNALDIIQGLEELVSSQGFGGASDVDHCIASSGTVKELAQYVFEAEDIPFAYSIPPFPVVKEGKPVSSFLQIGEAPPGEHIPAWLPAFPEPQTYLQLPTVNEGAADSNIHNVEQARLDPETEKPHLNLPQQFNCNGSGGPSSLAPVGSSEANLAVESNPFLVAPLHFGEKVVSQVVPPAKLLYEAAPRSPIVQNRLPDTNISVVDTFAPAIEAMKSRLSDSEEGQKNVILDHRPAVRFKIGFGRKFSGAALESKSQNKGVESISLLSGKDTEKDDKKKRAEKILKQSIENPGELAQM
ncbi:transcription initiation factor TFIID subunit 8 [Euphorbia lathyris]|uniref:transcription initiation factor TFIID subunit 8 n=1 Tax=Euphorbia lathyris TaxID=212925 RepID=UPI00331440CB